MTAFHVNQNLNNIFLNFIYFIAVFKENEMIFKQATFVLDLLIGCNYIDFLNVKYIGMSMK